MLSFNNYSKQFGDNIIISIPQLLLPHGIYWLKGENGSGKTTLIKSIAGLIPFEGNISVADADIKTNRMQYTTMVNYAEAEPLYPAFLSGNDLLEFYRQTKKAGNEQINELITALGIAGYAPNKTATYSSGMAKKLSLVLGFMGNSRLILLDEPLITLDTRSVQILQGLIQQYYAAGVSFLITSHQELSFDSIQPTRLIIKDKTLLKA